MWLTCEDFAVKREEGVAEVSQKNGLFYENVIKKQVMQLPDRNRITCAFLVMKD